VLERALIIRPHNIAGEDAGNEHVIPHLALRMNRLVKEYPTGVIPFSLQGDGTQTRSFCYVGDFTNQFLLALDKAPQSGAHIFHLGREDERTIAELAREVAACYGREIKIVPGDLPKGSPVRRLPDTRKLRALGPLPDPVPFEEIVRRTVAWYKEH
jgi:UDP-glucose 4-epimerase